MGTIGHLPISSKGNRWAFTAVFLHMYFVFALLTKEKSAESVVQAYLSGIPANKGGNVAILVDNGTDFQYKVLNEVCGQLSIKRLFPSPFHPQGNEKLENVHSFLKNPQILGHSNLKWDELLPFACYCYNIFSGSNSTESPFFLMFGQDPTEGHLSHLNYSNRYY